MATITSSVGRVGTNMSQDVSTVQSLLNRHRNPPLTKLDVDGRIGPKTTDAIEEFQRRVVKLSNPDGRVDPNGKTLTALNGSGGLGLPGFVGAILFSVKLWRNPAWRNRRQTVLLGTGIMLAGFLISFIGIAAATAKGEGVFGPDTLVGWPNRIGVLGECIWTVLIAWQSRRIAKPGADRPPTEKVREKYHGRSNHSARRFPQIARFRVRGESCQALLPLKVEAWIAYDSAAAGVEPRVKWSQDGNPK
ncbi:MAG: peptidoglycan-binding protein [Planctomycetes bacterium]|nr:peptidoglycan-binding protein [Planctomycetota bacterium]